MLTHGFPHSSVGKESACNAEDPGLISGSGRLPGEENGNPPQYLAWRIPWTEGTGRLQSMGLQESDMIDPLNHHHQTLTHYHFKHFSYTFLQWEFLFLRMLSLTCLTNNLSETYLLLT